MAVPECGVGLTRAVFVADQPIEPRWAETVLARGTPEAGVTLALPADVVALGTILAVTLLSTERSVCANRAFLLASSMAQETFRHSIQLATVTQ